MGIIRRFPIFNINMNSTEKPNFLKSIMTPKLHSYLEFCRKNGIEIQRFDDNEFASMIADNVFVGETQLESVEGLILKMDLEIPLFKDFK